MGIFLNSIAPYTLYCELVSDTYFVDKSLLLRELFPALGKKNRYFCVTRPRRFGESVMADMISAFFGKFTDENHLFDQLTIAEDESYHLHLHRHNVIFIDFSQEPRDCTNYSQYITRIQNGINRDLIKAYPEIEIDVSEAVWDILLTIFQETRDKYYFNFLSISEKF